MNSLVVSVAAFAAVLCAVCAYDFQDASFNQILARDLQDLHAFYDDSSRFHHRSRRDEEAAMGHDKCKRGGWKRVCCAEETLEADHEKDKDLKRECFKEVIDKNKDQEPSGEVDPFKCHKADRFRKDMKCLTECIGKKKGLIGADGNVVEEEVTKMVQEFAAKEAWFEPLADKVAAQCVAESKNATANLDPSDTSSCNPAAIKLVHCLFKEVQLGCPADQIKDQKTCDKVRDRINRIDEGHPPIMPED